MSFEPNTSMIPSTIQTLPNRSGRASGVTFPLLPSTYGVYIVRSAADDSVLYIGIGGSVMTNGTLKGQDIVERLRNVRDGGIPADTWFKDLLSRGPLRIQYFLCLPPVSPAFLEALLLQAYLSEHGRLPEKNRRL